MVYKPISRAAMSISCVEFGARGSDGGIPLWWERAAWRTSGALSPAEAGGVALYARVSSAVQKNDFDRQLARLTE